MIQASRYTTEQMGWSVRTVFSHLWQLNHKIHECEFPCPQETCALWILVVFKYTSCRLITAIFINWTKWMITFENNVLRSLRLLWVFFLFSGLCSLTWISENYEQSLSQSLKQTGILTLLVSTSETPRCSVYNNTKLETNGSVDVSLINNWHEWPVIIFLVDQVINHSTISLSTKRVR